MYILTQLTLAVDEMCHYVEIYRLLTLYRRRHHVFASCRVFPRRTPGLSHTMSCHHLMSATVMISALCSRFHS